MIYYLGNTFAIPSFLAFVDFFAWAVVCKRMANLGIPKWQRAIILAWTSATLSLAVIDVTDVHHFSSETRAAWVVSTKSLIRIGNLGLAVIFYKLLAKAYPNRMRASPVEPDPVFQEAQQ